VVLHTFASPMSDGPHKPVTASLVLSPELEELAWARRFVSAAATAAGFDDARTFDVVAASSEAVGDTIEHAPIKGEITIKTTLYENSLDIQVLGPGEFQTPHRLTNGHAHRGLGLPLMAQFSDHLALYSGPSGGTLVSLTFYISGGEEAGRQGLAQSVAELVEENELVSAITDNAPLGLFVLDRELRYRWANPAYQSFVQEPFRSRDLTGLFVGDVLRGLAESGGIDELRQAAQSGVALGPSEGEFKAPSGGPTWWRRSVVPLTAGATAPPYELHVVVSDETERKQAEEALRAGEQKYHDLYSSLDQGYVVIDVLFDEEGRAVDQHLVEANPAALCLQGNVSTYTRLSELAPLRDAAWYELAGRVALTGGTARTRTHVEKTNRWHESQASRRPAPARW
jgi:PAS domain-containing protein